MGLYMLGWGGDNGDPDNFLGYFFNSGAEPIKQEGWYQNAELAAILQEAVTLPDPEARAALYRQAEQMLHDDVGQDLVGAQQYTSDSFSYGSGLCTTTCRRGEF